MMRIFRYVPLLGLLIAFNAFGACDCSRIVGQCNAAIEFVNAFGAKPSYGAEIVVHSSARRCSKVEYYLDNTPHQTILRNSQKEPESLFGTKPITAKSIQLIGCRVCASQDGEAQPAGPAPATPPAPVPMAVDAPFHGTWSGSIRWFLISDPVRLELAVNGTRVTGTFSNKTATIPIQNGRVEGDRLTFNYTGEDGTVGETTLVLTDGRTVNADFRAGPGITFSGQLRKQ